MILFYGTANCKKGRSPRCSVTAPVTLPHQRTSVYIDGFNLYYGSLRGTPYRWLDPDALCRRFLQPHQELTAIKYFTAKVQERDGGEQNTHQAAYLRALRTIPHLSIYYGQFITRTAVRKLEHPPRPRRKRRGRPDNGFRSVWITEEKGSDVNLASHLLADGFRARYDLAIVISNDSDLKMPIEIVRKEFKAGVGVLNPHKRRSWALSPRELPRGSFYRQIRPGALAACQFPDPHKDGEGEILCPEGWTGP